MRSKFDGGDRSGSGVEMAEPRVTVDRDAVVDSTAEMFTNLSAYLQGELKANNIDYQLVRVGRGVVMDGSLNIHCSWKI